MKILLYVNALFEGVFGAVAIATPATVWPGADALAQSLGRAFGFAALSVAVLSVLAASHARERSVRAVVFGGLVAWHLGLTVAELLAALQHLAPPPVAAIHGLFTLAFAYCLWRNVLAKGGAAAPAPAP